VWVTLANFYWYLAEHGIPHDYSFANAAKLTKKEGIDITLLKTVVIPLHVEPNHWAVIVINLEQKSIHYFDSLHAPNDTINVDLGNVYVPQTDVNGPLGKFGPALRNCARWVVDEFFVKSPSDVKKDVSFWKGIVHSKRNVPQQDNDVDCGVFCIHMLKTFAEGRGPCFDTGGGIDVPNIPLMRRQIALSIVNTSSLAVATAAALTSPLPVTAAIASAPASAPASDSPSLTNTQTQIIT